MSSSAGTRLQEILANGGLTTVFQPIVNLHNGEVTGVEALCRDRHPEPTSVLDLLDAARDAGQLWDFERQSRFSCFSELVDLPSGNRLFINCSSEVFADARLVESLTQEVDACEALDAESLVVEITEQTDAEGLVDQAQRLEKFGVQIAIDDIGEGASGLNRILNLRPSWMKLDRKFVSDIHRDAFRQNLIRFFVHFASLNGSSVIAEGVEKQEELVTLIELGVRFAQGYYLARPEHAPTAFSTDLAASIKQRWQEAEKQASLSSSAARLGRLCRPALIVQDDDPIHRVGQELIRSQNELGALVLHQRRLVGWCDKRIVLANATSSAAAAPISTIMSPCICALSPEATVRHGLDLLCLRNDEQLAQPIVIGEGANFFGVVPARDLLRAISLEPQELKAFAQSAIASRAEIDEKLTELISRRSNHDAATIDFKGFADFRQAFGNGASRELVADLASLIERHLNHPDDAIGHLGEDRFIVTGSHDLESRLRSVMSDFEATQIDVKGRLLSVRSAAGVLSEDEVVPNLTLRVCVLPSVFLRVERTSDIYRIETQLRQRARRIATPGRRVVLVTDRRIDSVSARKSA